MATVAKTKTKKSAPGRTTLVRSRVPMSRVNGKPVTNLMLTVTGGNKQQREVLATLLHDHIHNHLDIPARNDDVKEPVDALYAQRIALTRLSGTKVDVRVG